MTPAVLPIVAIANPKEGGAPVKEKKEKRKLSEKQLRAARRNIKKAQAARKAAAAPKSAPKVPKKEKKKMATAKQIAAARRNIKKAQAANRGGRSRPRHNPSRPKHRSHAGGGGGGGHTRRRRRNPGGGSTHVSRGIALLEVGSGVAVGGIAAGATDYLIVGTAMFSNPGPRGALHTGVGLVVGLGGAAAMPKAMGFFGGVGGAFVGLGVANLLRWAFSGTKAASSSAQQAADAGAGAGAGNGGGAGMAAVTARARIITSADELRQQLRPHHGRMGAVIQNPRMAAVIARTRRAA